MVFNADTAEKTAEFLLQIKAIKLQPEQPFTWASGWNSPIYCDNRLSLSYPAIRNYIRSSMAELIEEHYPSADVIAGVATGAIAVGALVAEQLGLPFVYVRSKAKEHGRQNLIEGHLPEGANVVVIEDLVSTGMSSLQAVDALRDAGARVLGMGAIFTYGFDVSEEAFEKANCQLVTLSNYDHLILKAVEGGYVDKSQEMTLNKWRVNPSEWNK
ncbi:orotate phosphoribosyltransferase [Phaeocystidibacter luteus]|uniref:Orotate phosphoribosyltransferase n=1 Tax=Phaeocystidibacter luteus TaxID=911197 RepID=A0A6N6RFL1_9FLAO|nr:orotate phosphoribosyltransferase [Phaeocystidibacter luteus]KAB2806808.1 orotate phosphoribosyltransferase [Phaeocystidibacter luteus]